MEIENKYSVQGFPLNVITGWYHGKEIAVPEIQRPFVWGPTKVRKLFDSLYQGYPIGYFIVWKNPNVKLKDGRTSEGKKILIDGQQRIMGLITAIFGEEIIDEEYRKHRIVIAFNPQTETFEVLNPAILKDSTWLPDIGPIIRGDIRSNKLVTEYCEKNPPVNREQIEDSIENLRRILSRPIGYIELSHDLDIQTVTEIFIRVNKEGVSLDESDFAMSKIAANESYGGATLRKCIDYFCHLLRNPSFYATIKQDDKEFAKTEFFQKISWLKDENEGLFAPGYSDMLRVAFTSEFNRGKLADLVSLLSGRNFEKKTYEEQISKESFEKLEQGIVTFINETNFKRFIMIIKSAGFISAYMIRSKNVLNFAYILYLKLRALGYNPAEIESFVKRWFVLSILTERYTSSPESQFDSDIKSVSSKKFKNFLQDIESADLSDAYWKSALIQNLETTSSNSPYFNVFLAAQVKANDKGFLSKDITVKDMITQRGDIHHIFPKEYLKRNGLTRGGYNQIANYVYMQTEINIKIDDYPPKEYLFEVLKQCKEQELKYGGINNEKELLENFKSNCIPEDIVEMEFKGYEKFLEKRRELMASKIKAYYYSL